MTTTSPVYSEPGAAVYLGVSRRSLQKWRFERRGPAYHKFGKRVVYHTADLDAFLNAHRIEPGAA